MNRKLGFVFCLFIFTGCKYLDGLEGTKDKSPDTATFQEKSFSVDVPSDTFVYGYSKQVDGEVDHISVTSDGVAIPADHFRLNSAVKGIWFYHASSYRVLTVTLYSVTRT